LPIGFFGRANTCFGGFVVILASRAKNADLSGHIIMRVRRAAEALMIFIHWSLVRAEFAFVIDPVIYLFIRAS